MTGTPLLQNEMFFADIYFDLRVKKGVYFTGKIILE
jgi:hypothetical protein